MMFLHQINELISIQIALFKKIDSLGEYPFVS